MARQARARPTVLRPGSRRIELQSLRTPSGSAWLVYATTRSNSRSMCAHGRRNAASTSRASGSCDDPAVSRWSMVSAAATCGSSVHTMEAVESDSGRNAIVVPLGRNL